MSGGADGNGESGEPPAGMGTAVFNLCDDGIQQPGPRLLRLLTRDEYANTIADLLHLAPPDVANLPVEAQVRGYDNNASAQAVTSRHVDTYLKHSSALAEMALERSRGRLVPCDASASGCPRQFVESFGLRAFRRPLADEELARYQALFAPELTEGNFDQGVRLVIEAMLVSPSFLYRSEVGAPQPDGTFKLSAYETATALSYLYWGTMPDEALFSAAQQGMLATTEQRSEQAKRLLRSPRARDQLQTFALQWLGTSRILNTFKDPDHFPSFSDGVREAMLEEQKRLFSKVVLDDSETFVMLYQPNYVMMNGELAQYYGLPAPPQPFSPVDPGTSQRGGILGLGAVSAAHAHSNESSPIRRGLFVRDRLLCQDLPAPPQNLDTTPPGLDPRLTTRERFATHTADNACRGCHQYIDGVGFGFEGFDGAGKLRLVENGMDVDTSGQLVGLESLGDTSSFDFSGVQELAGLIARSDVAKSCLTLQFFRYGRGYEERNSDACALSALRERFAGDNYRVVDLLIALSELDSFVMRQAP